MRVCSHTQNDVMSARFPHHRHLLLLRHRYSHTHIRIYLNHVQMAKVRFYDRIETSPFQIFYFLATLVIRFAFFLRDVEPNFHTSRNKKKKKLSGDRRIQVQLKREMWRRVTLKHWITVKEGTPTFFFYPLEKKPIPWEERGWFRPSINLMHKRKLSVQDSVTRGRGGERGQI